MDGVTGHPTGNGERLQDWRIGRLEEEVKELKNIMAGLIEFKTELRVWAKSVTWAVRALTALMIIIIGAFAKQVLGL